jgi:autophagy-related protein 17
LATTNDYPESLASTISSIRNSLPATAAAPSIDEVLNFQDSTSTHMAGHLESLAGHYEQMASALRDSEAGEAFSDDDLQGMLI